MYKINLSKIKEIKILKNFKIGWHSLNFFERSQIILMIILSLCASFISLKQTDINNRLLLLEEKKTEPILSVEIGEYSKPTTSTILINPILYNAGSVPVSIIGTGFHVYEENTMKNIFSLTYGRGLAGEKIGPGSSKSLPYEITASKEIFSLYRFDIIYKNESNNKEKCETIILSKGDKNFFQINKTVGCPKNIR
ncbi:MAG: hypothetical protein WCV83_01180 [Candidatus Magasanikbacteria bacterium]